MIENKNDSIIFSKLSSQNKSISTIKYYNESKITVQGAERIDTIERTKGTTI